MGSKLPDKAPDECLFSDFHGEVCVFSQERHLIPDVLSKLKRQLAEQENRLGATHVSAQLIKNNIAVCYRMQDKPSDAQRLHEEVYETLKVELGATHKYTLYAKSDVASSLTEQQKHAEGIAMFEDLLTNLTDELHDTSYYALDIKLCLGRSKTKLKEYDDAIDILSKALEEYEKKLRPDHPELLNCAITLARSKRAAGKNSECIELLNEVLDKRLINLKSRTDITIKIVCTYELAKSYAMEKQLDKSVTILQNMLSSSELKQLDESAYVLSLAKNRLAFNLIQLGKFSEANQILQDVYLKLTSGNSDGIYDNDVQDTSELINLCLFGNEDFEEGINHLHQLYDQSKNKYGREHERTLRNGRNLADGYSKIGCYSDAAAIIKSILNVSRSEEDRSTLGMLYCKLGKFRDAYNVFEDLHAIRKGLYGSEEKRTLSAQFNMAICLMKMNKRSEALQIFNKIYEVEKKSLGSQNQQTITTLFEVAFCRLELLQFEEALELFKEVYKAQTTNFGQLQEDDPEIAEQRNLPAALETYRRIAFCLFKVKKFKEARLIYEEIHGVLQKDQETKNFQVGSLYEERLNIIDCLLADEKYTEALSMLYDSIDETKVDHAEIATAFQGKLASILMEHEEYEGAHFYAETVYEFCRKKYGEKHPETLSKKTKIAQFFEKEGKHMEAIEICEDLYDVARELYGSKDPITINNRNNIAMLWYKDKQYAKALDLFEEIYDTKKVIAGNMNMYALSTRNLIGCCLFETGRYVEALATFQETYNAQRALLGKIDGGTISLRINIGHCLEKLDRMHEAVAIYWEVYESEYRAVLLEQELTLLRSHGYLKEVDTKHDSPIQSTPCELA